MNNEHPKFPGVEYGSPEYYVILEAVFRMLEAVPGAEDYSRNLSNITLVEYIYRLGYLNGYQKRKAAEDIIDVVVTVVC